MIFKSRVLFRPPQPSRDHGCGALTSVRQTFHTLARTYFQSPRSGGYGAAPSGGGLRVLTFVLGVLVIGFVALVVFFETSPWPSSRTPLSDGSGHRCAASNRCSSLCRVGARLAPVAVVAT